MAEELTVTIIGAGTKGAFGPVSHAEAFTRAGFKITGFVDSDPLKSERAVDQSGGKAFKDIQEAAKHPVDVIVVATPDETHEEVLKQTFGWSKVVFAEKPFTRSYEAAEKLINQFELCGQKVVVNYTRRFSTSFGEIQGLIRDGALGGFLGGSGFYGKGLYHNGSHMIDMLQMLLGHITVHGPGARITETYSNVGDPSVYGVLEVGYSPFWLGIIPRLAVNAFEANLYFDLAAVRITNIGRLIEIRQVETRPDYPGDRIYGQMTEMWDIREPMMVAVQNIKDHLLNGMPLLSTAENALKVLKVCQELVG